ncbi:hypothetical protein HMN09_00149500 [Mycena chlorophos]|uniref:Uncharacterized protein n=1 Tax=Mycena chlorophos TaxID=658473 RepID=A0A8H6TPV7_MYCCL|nr:hypothetical protein HMN09_00149500 [Mycena chlorophos]
MHPSLELRPLNLRKLPPHVRLLVAAATRPGADNDDVVNLLDRLINSNWPESTLRLLMPVFHAFLDPSQLVMLRNIEEYDPDTRRDYFLRSLNALSGLELLVKRQRRLDRAVATELWERVWVWLQFIDEYHQCLRMETRARQLVDASLAYEKALAVTRALSKDSTGDVDPDVRGAVVCTPAIFEVFGRAWVYLLDHAPPGNVGLTELATFYIALTESPQRLQALVDGTGGSYAHLADAIVRNLHSTVPDPTLPLSEPIYIQVQGLLLLNKATQNIELDQCLLSRGIIRALTRVGRALSAMDLGRLGGERDLLGFSPRAARPVHPTLAQRRCECP